MNVLSRRTAVRAFLAALAAASLVSNGSPSGAATIVGKPANDPSALVRVDACSLAVNSKGYSARPKVAVSASSRTNPRAVSAQVEFNILDPAGNVVNTSVVSVPVAPSDVPLPAYSVPEDSAGLTCRLHSTTLSDETVVLASPTSVAAGGGGQGTALGILGGALLLGGLAVAGHGSSSNHPTSQPVVGAPPTRAPTEVPTILPTILPTASPPGATPTPGPLTVSPNTLSFLAAGSNLAQTTQASETGYSGAFSVTPTSCSGSSGPIASVSPGSTTTGAFSVTPQGAGSCTFIVSDSQANSASFMVTVTLPTTLKRPRARSEILPQRRQH